MVSRVFLVWEEKDTWMETHLDYKENWLDEDWIKHRRELE